MAWTQWLLGAVSVGCCWYWYRHYGIKIALIHAVYYGIWNLWFYVIRAAVLG